MGGVLIGGLIIVGCVNSTKPAGEPQAPPSQKLAEKSGVPMARLQEGYGIYMRQCYQCHTQPSLSKLSSAQWEAMVPVMGDHAGISNKETEKVLEYLLARKLFEE